MKSALAAVSSQKFCYRIRLDSGLPSNLYIRFQHKQLTASVPSSIGLLGDYRVYFPLAFRTPSPFPKRNLSRTHIEA